MSLVVINNASRDMSIVKKLAEKYYPYAQKVMGFDRSPKLYFESDMNNAKNPLGKTAFYNPESSEITIYVDGRHPKDIMRSFSHELVHHAQNCQGQFNNSGPTEEGYAQKDPHLREMEEDAYRRGNLCFRDWENQYNLKEIKTKMEKSFTSEELKTVIQGALQQILEARGVENFEDLEEATDTEVEDINEEEEELEEGGAADRPENKDKHVAAPDRGRRVHENDESDGDTIEEEEEIFAPNHYCVHHGGVNHNGKIEMAETVNHNYNEELGRVTHYDMKLEDGTVLENVAFEDIQVTEASLAEGHGGHSMKRDDSDKEDDFPDLTGDGKVTRADILKGRGVKLKEDEVEDRPLKEWYEGSIYGKLLKEWTKEN